MNGEFLNATGIPQGCPIEACPCSIRAGGGFFKFLNSSRGGSSDGWGDVLPAPLIEELRNLRNLILYIKNQYVRRFAPGLKSLEGFEEFAFIPAERRSPTNRTAPTPLGSGRWPASLPGRAAAPTAPTSRRCT